MYVYSMVCILYQLLIYVLLLCIIDLCHVFINRLYVFIPLNNLFGHKILPFIGLKKHYFSFLTYHISRWCCLVDNKPVIGPPGCPSRV